MSEEEAKKKVYAAVHFYDDQNKTIVFVESTNIKYFDANDPEIYKKPHYVERIDNISGEKQYYPAQIHKIADTINELEKNEKRYRYHKIRASDAAFELECKYSNDSNTADKLTSDDKILNEKSRITVKKNNNVDNNEQIHDSNNEVEIQKKLTALQQVSLTFEKDITEEAKLKNEILTIQIERGKIIAEYEKKVASYEEILAQQKKLITELRLEVLELKDEVSFLRSKNEKVPYCIEN